MMFMMIPPTTSDTEAMAASRIDMAAGAFLGLEDFGHIANAEVIILGRLNMITLPQQIGHLILRRGRHALARLNHDLAHAGGISLARSDDFFLG
jgi:hypothetical protein